MPQAASSINGMPSQSRAMVGMHLISNPWRHPLAELIKSWGAKRGANADRRQATQADVQRQSLQLTGSSGHARRRPATVKLRLTSEGSLVRPSCAHQISQDEVPPPSPATCCGRPRHGPLLRLGRGDRGCTGRLKGGGKQVASRQAAGIFKCTYADRPYPYRCGSTRAEQPVITPASSSRCTRR
jgi:hypothetical protein